MTGNETDARRALDMWNNRDYSHVLSFAGSSRAVFFINGIVYKVNLSDYDFNMDEWINYLRLRNNLPTGFFLPETSIHYVDGKSVIAMEYIDGIPTGACEAEFLGIDCDCGGMCLSDDILNPLESLDINDCAYGNIINCDGAFYLVDIAC